MNIDITLPKETVCSFRTYYKVVEYIDDLAHVENLSRTDMMHKLISTYGNNSELGLGIVALQKVRPEEAERCSFPPEWDYVPNNKVVVYILTNTVDGNQYVGSTINKLRSRLSVLLSVARHGGSEAISRAMRKYGPGKFTVHVVPCKKTMLRQLERYYIEALDTIDNGYNNAIPQKSDYNGM